MTNNTTGPVYADYGQYIGPLFTIGANQTPFLGYVGGLNGYVPAATFEFPMEVYSQLEAASATGVTEAAAVAGTNTQEAYLKAQLTNTCQMFLRNITVSYVKISERAKIEGIAFRDSQAFQDELTYQTSMNLQQLAVNMELAALTGTYATKTNSSSIPQTRGIITATQAGACKVDASSNPLTTDHIDAVAKLMADGGAPFTNMVLFCNSFQKKAITDLYGWSPIAAAGTGMGGVNVARITTNFFDADVVFAPQVPAAKILIADMDKVSLRGIEVPGLGAVFVEEKGKVGAGYAYQMYAQLGIDYSDPSFHGVIYGLTTS